MPTSSTKKPEYLDEAFEQVLQEMLLTFIKKHKDYGKDNILDTGELGILFRINDKIRRIQNLVTEDKAPKNETIEDNWLDIAVYAAIAIILKRGYFKDLDLSPEA